MSEDSAVCPNCGAHADVAPAPVEDSVEQTTVLETPAFEAAPVAPEAPVAPAEPAFAEVSFEEKAAPEKKKWWLIPAIVGGVLAVLAVLALIFWNQLSGFWLKTFAPEEEYFQHVEKQALSVYTEDIAKVYGDCVEQLGNDEITAQAQMSLTVSDEVLDLITENTGMEIELDWINDVTFDLDTVMDGEQMMVCVAVAVGGQEVVDMNVIVDQENNRVLMGVPSLSDKYMQEDVYGTAAITSIDRDMLKALPSEEEVQKLLDKYLEIALSEMTKVSKETDTLEIGDVSQKVTVLEYELTEKEALAICKAVLKEAKSDKDLKKIVERVADYAEEAGMLSDADEVYDSFKEGIENTLDELKEVEPEKETFLVLTDYVNGAHEIVGRKLTVEEQDVFYYATAIKGKEFATEMEVSGAMEIQGEGTIEGNIRKGEYVLIVEEQELLVINAELDEKKLEEMYISGKFDITPTEVAMELMELDSSVSSVIKSMGLGLQVIVDSSEDVAKLEMNVTSNGKVMVGLGLDAKNGSDKKIEIPDSGDVIDAYDSDEWIASLDLSKLVENLKNTSIPSDLVDLLEMAVGQITAPVYSDSYDYNY